MANGTEERPGRETRLLMLVVGVSVAVLLLLARLRFPTAELASVAPGAAPLAGLAARATFDEMADTMTDVLSRVSASLAVVELVPTPDVPEGRGRKTMPPVESLWMPALRVSADLALVYLPAGHQVASGLNLDGPVELVAADLATSFALIRVPSRTGFPEGFTGASKGLAGPAYVAVIEGTPAGPSVQPVFIGRADAVSEASWPQALLRVPPQTALSPGAWVFAVNGRLIGAVTSVAPATRLAPADALETVVARLLAPGASH